MSLLDQQAVTVRLPKDLYQATATIAKADKKSFNALVQESLARTVRERRYVELYDAFTVAAEDEEEMSVEYAFAAQSEVVLRDETD